VQPERRAGRLRERDPTLVVGRVCSRPVTDLTPIDVDPDPYEPFRLSQGFRVGDLLLISGQAAIDEHGQLVGVGDFDAQAEQTFRNLQRVLEAGGSSLDRVVKVTIFLTDMANFPKIVELRGTWFTPPYPADSIVQVVSLALPELEIEIEAIAVAG
jgi:2-iminobutanoate/2-iminopropanoate deaminase